MKTKLKLTFKFSPALCEHLGRTCCREGHIMAHGVLPGVVKSGLESHIDDISNETILSKKCTSLVVT